MNTKRPYVQMYKDELVAWRKRRLSGTEWDVLMVIAERTWGWHKTDIALSHSEIAKDTGRNRRQVMRAIDSLKSASILGSQGRERQKSRYRINPPEVYTTIKANLVTKMVSDEANYKIHHASPNPGDKNDTSTDDIYGTNLVTSSSIKATPLNKPLIKKEIKDRKAIKYSEKPQGDYAPIGANVPFSGKDDAINPILHAESILGTPIERVLVIWRANGAPVINVGWGTNCFDLEDDLLSGNLNDSQLNVLKSWLNAKVKHS